ncbi:MAG: radical SAM protein [Desulfobacteraceae bacterium]|nr:MAG: radical SAM protein [Desulfobacteraceae bacterium]
MTFPCLNGFTISVEKQSPGKIAKASFPLRYGTCSEIKTSEYEFLFNLNGEIKFIRGLNVNWSHPAEQLKRTNGNDWVYYSVGDKSGDKGIISWLGEYYLPCLPYPSNSIWEINYLSNPGIMNAFAAWSQLYANLYGAKRDGLHSKAKELLDLILKNDDKILYERSQELSAITGGRVSVLPPDTRHVDYEIVPVIIADGCLYHCNFCCVKSAQKFRQRSKNDILEQIRRLKVHYSRDLQNYNALFLGNHDALEAGAELICFTASEAFESFGFGEARAMTPLLFLFGSIDSLLNSETELFDKLNRLPFYTYINIGFESADMPTLELIGKPVNVSKVQAAFRKMLEINAAFTNIEITGNFLIGDQLSHEHYQSLAELLRNASGIPRGKGAIYLSPLKDSPKKRELLPRFIEIKDQSQLPVYIYLIQRL